MLPFSQRHYQVNRKVRTNISISWFCFGTTRSSANSQKINFSIATCYQHSKQSSKLAHHQSLGHIYVSNISLQIFSRNALKYYYLQYIYTSRGRTHQALILRNIIGKYCYLMWSLVLCSILFYLYFGYIYIYIITSKLEFDLLLVISLTQ